MSGPLDFDPEPGEERPRPPAAPRRGPGTPEPVARSRHRHPPVLAPVAPGGGRYLWVVGAAALVLVVVLIVATIGHGTDEGARGVPQGTVMPPFAVPLATSDLDGDANLAVHAGEGQAGDRPACSVRGPRILNGCALHEGAPVVLAFFGTGEKECVQQLDVLEHVRASAPGVRFAAIAIRGDRDAVRTMIARHHWGFPIGWDRDGALANAYHVQVCPQLTFARAGGRVARTTFGKVSPRDLQAKVRELVAGGR